jgi:pilus assembly protein CpaC
VGDSIVLSGSVSTVREAEDVRRLAAQFVAKPKNVIDRMQISGPTQINLRVRIVEISRNVVRQLGINWDEASSIGSNILLGFATGGATFVGNTFSATANIATRRNGTNSAIFGYRGQRHTINGVLDALQTQGLVKTLAEPNLTAISGETASFLAGGEFPVPVPQDGGVITVQYKKFGVGLSFTPTLLSPRRISLKVNPEVSQLSNAGSIQIQGINVPSLTTRRASTTVELASGQSFAIAGLLQNNYTKDISKVPGIGDIPILGKLFTSENYRKDETELVIIVTPYIVRPFDPHRARLAAAARAATRPRERNTDVNELIFGRRSTASRKKKGGTPAAKGTGIAGVPPRKPAAGGPPHSLRGPSGFELE